MTSIPRHNYLAKAEIIRDVVNWRWLAPLLYLIPLLVDPLIRSRPPARWFEAILDESGHAATTVILFLALMSVVRRPIALSWLVAVLAGGILIDVDHIPSDIFGWDVITAGAIRPYSHSLSTVASLCFAGLARSGPARGLLLLAAYGVATHLLPDMATGGVPLLWPLGMQRVQVAYPVYMLLLGVAALVSVIRRRHERASASTEGNEKQPAVLSVSCEVVAESP
jgi:membrane-bound metal-dependent hydrolase YbcI (DUF457 family)